ncbi:MAG: 50S ribosomal protein L2 [Rickettsiaceae bacterium]
MALKNHNPVTSSSRGYVKIDRSKLWKGKPHKSLVVGGVSVANGRNNLGRITTRHKGGGHKRCYRIIDFHRNKFGVEAVVQRIEYDPNRTAFIALLKYDDNEYAYILAPQSLNVGDKVIANDSVETKIGNCSYLKNIPVGTTIHNIEMKVGKGSQMARSAGTYAMLVGKDNGYAQIKLMSGEIRLVNLLCKATIGAVSNPSQKNITVAKAGRSRWKGIRPTVRGVAMNPVDHPHGGGEGKTSGGRHPVTPWGKSTKGKKTRKNKMTSKFILKRK